MSFMDQRAVEIAVWGEGIRRLCGIKTQRNEILLAAIATDPNLRDRHVRLISDDDIDGVEGGDLRNGGLNTGDGCSNIGGKRREAARCVQDVKDIGHSRDDISGGLIYNARRSGLRLGAFL